MQASLRTNPIYQLQEHHQQYYTSYQVENESPSSTSSSLVTGPAAATTKPPECVQEMLSISHNQPTYQLQEDNRQQHQQFGTLDEQPLNLFQQSVYPHQQLVGEDGGQFTDHQTTGCYSQATIKLAPTADPLVVTKTQPSNCSFNPVSEIQGTSFCPPTTEPCHAADQSAITLTYQQQQHPTVYYEPENQHHFLHGHLTINTNCLPLGHHDGMERFATSFVPHHQNQVIDSQFDDTAYFQQAGDYTRLACSHDQHLIQQQQAGESEQCYLQSSAATPDPNNQIYQTLSAALPSTGGSQFPEHLHDYQQQQQQIATEQVADFHQQQQSCSQSYHIPSDVNTTKSSDNDYLKQASLESAGVSVASHSRDSSFSSAASTSSEDSSLSSTLTRDERRAREANIPMSYHQIVNLSIDEFNDQLSKHALSESQLTLIKDIRRRGKNKVAAQSCRKRKMEQIFELQHEVNNLSSERRSLAAKRAKIAEEHANLVQKLDKIRTIVRFNMQQRQHHHHQQKQQDHQQRHQLQLDRSYQC